MRVPVWSGLALLDGLPKESCESSWVDQGYYGYGLYHPPRRSLDHSRLPSCEAIMAAGLGSVLVYDVDGLEDVVICR